MSTTIQVIFFDLGDTFVSRDVSGALKLLPGAKDLLAQLHAKGVRLGIISNTGNLTRAQLTAELPPDFDWAVFEPGLVILSSEVGVEKRRRAVGLVEGNGPVQTRRQAAGARDGRRVM